MGKHNVKSPKHLNLVRSYPCIVCLKHKSEESPANAHHLTRNPFTGEYKGMGQKLDDYITIPLCELHHQGNVVGYTESGETAIHKNTPRFEERYGTQAELYRDFMTENCIKLPKGYIYTDEDVSNI